MLAGLKKEEGAGGIDSVVITLANEFALRGVQTDLVVRQDKSPFMPLVAGGVHVVNLQAYLHPGRNILMRLRSQLASLRAVSALCNYVAKRRPRALVAPTFVENLYVILARTLTGSDCRVVISQHPTFSMQLLTHCGPAKRALMRWIARLLYPRADAAVAVSRDVADDLARVVPDISTKLRVIYNPVDVDRVQRLSLEEPDHTWYKDGSHLVILGVGRLCREKEFPTLVKAFARVRETRPMKLVILGEGKDRQLLEALVAQLGLGEDVSLPGFVGNPYSYFTRSAVFALSSSTEGFPVVMLEALACGCPVVSTDCRSGPCEILESGKWGELVPVGDADALAAAIERTLRNPPSPDLLKQRAEFFSVERAASEYLDAVRRPGDNQPLTQRVAP